MGQQFSRLSQPLAEIHHLYFMRVPTVEGRVVMAETRWGFARKCANVLRH